jgi:hypothetical protein
MYTKEEIKQQLSTNPKWIERGLVVLYQRQTYEEQQSGGTIVDNKMGFNGSDSRYLTYCSKWVLSGNRLNEKHLQKCGKMLPKYWKQIMDIIKSKGN